MPKIFVIIVTYKGHIWYDRCFSSLRNSSQSIHTVVVDNASGDGTVEFIQKNYPEIYIIPSEKNLGFGQGNNIGIRYALENEADYVFLLNQDAWIVESDLFSNLINIAEKHPEYAIISPMQLYGSGERITHGVLQHFVDGQKSSSDFISDLFFLKERKDVYEVPYVCAASWFISKKIIQEIGGFDPIFFHYGEDDNYIQRVAYRGHKIGICPNVSICHDVEKRENNYGQEYQNWQKNLLLELTDINKKVNLASEKKHYLKKSIVQYLFFQVSKAKLNMQVYKFIRNQSKHINESREMNNQVNKNWL